MEALRSDLGSSPVLLQDFHTCDLSCWRFDPMFLYKARTPQLHRSARFFAEPFSEFGLPAVVTPVIDKDLFILCHGVGCLGPLPPYSPGPSSDDARGDLKTELAFISDLVCHFPPPVLRHLSGHLGSNLFFCFPKMIQFQNFFLPIRPPR